MKTLILNGSARRNGNSVLLAKTVAEGVKSAGHEVEMHFVDDVVGSFLKDCRKCRKADGTCSIDDNFQDVFLRSFLPADGIIFSTPVYWYGMSAQLKAFFDRMFCYVAASYPQSKQITENMMKKRIGVVLSSEETYPTVAAGIVHQLQEYSRYTGSIFVGTIHGVGNSREEILKDPSMPVTRAKQFGENFFDKHTSDYKINTPRSGKVWG